MNTKRFLTQQRNNVILLLAFCSLFSSGLTQAEVVCASGLSCTQTITLRPGWNSIFVQVKPDQGSTDQVFADLVDGTGPQISSVWTWLAHRAKIDFIQDPDSEDLLSKPGWLRYFSTASSKTFLNNLYAIQANRAYLVKLEGNETAELSLTGTPVIPSIKWQSNAFNHLGFHIDPLNKPTFSDFFASSAAHVNQPIYKLVNDQWKRVDVFSEEINPDVAYWVFSKTGSHYLGPIDVSLPLVGRLEYASVLEQMTAQINNKIDSAQSISVQILGNAPGMYYPNPDATATESWIALPSPLTLNMAAGGDSRIPLGIRRADFALAEFNHVLQITSAAGSRWLIPVTASAPALNSLWVGSVTIEGISQVQNYQHNCIDTKLDDVINTYDSEGKSITLTYDNFAPNLATAGTGYDLCRDDDGFPVAQANTVTPVKKGGEFSFRVIVHREGSTLRLLKDVIQMWKPAVVDGNGVITEAGRYVLLTDDSLIPNFEGVSLRDGEVVGRRVSSVAYDFPGTSHPMAGALDGTMNTTLVLAADAPTNPFRHHYHNDHKGLGYAITRQMEFEKAVMPAAQKVSPLSNGREVIQGNYTEVISGLHKTPIILKGTYILRHAVAVNVLNQ